jgi:CBS domain containing-hemolysin-like protein
MVGFNEVFNLIILILLSGFFSASETALVAVSRFKVNLFVKRNKRGAQSLLKLKENSHSMLITLLICNNLVNIGASVYATQIALEIFSNNVLAYTTGIMTFLILVFGEIVPKSLANSKSEAISLFVAPLIYVLSIILYPLIWVFDLITVKVFRVKQLKPKITEEEVRNIVDIAKEEGGIDKEEKEMIHRIFKFDDIDVDEIKIPRTDMTAVQKKDKLKDIINIVKLHSRIPVYGEDKDKIEGIFYFKDALKYVQDKKLDVTVEKLMRNPIFIPETKKIDETLKLLQKKRQHMAIIIDEHGGVSGLVTMEDIIEEIVGEIKDETDKADPEIKKVDKKTFRVLGKTDIEDVNKKLKLRLKVEEDFDTLSGYILNNLGRIPKQGEEIDLKKAVITVNKVEENRIIDVIVRKK